MKNIGGILGLLGLFALLVPGCEKSEGATCYEAHECGEGLGCLGSDVRRCEKCSEDETCTLNGHCTGRGGQCIAADDSECKKAFICTGKGACTAKDGKCVVGADADCAQSEACKNEGYCKAKGNNCVLDPAKTPTEG